MKLSGFEGSSALVTGAAGGIGRALVEALVEAGARVLATDTAAAISGVAETMPREGVVWHPLDVRDPEAARAAVSKAEALHGPLRHLAHAAGVLTTGPVTEMELSDWRDLMDINAGGTLNLLGAAGRRMRAQGRGAIVVIGSNAGGIPRQMIGAYGASKAAAAMLTRCAGLELAAYGVRCNLVAPGSTLTPMQTGLWTDADAGAAAVVAGDAAAFRTGIPLGKLAQPSDIAAAALFLLSDEAGHVTMADLYVDGGGTLRA